MKSALVRTVPAARRAGVRRSVRRRHLGGRHRQFGELPAPATVETSLRRLAEGDRGVLDRLARRDAGYRAPAGAAARPRVVLLPGASAEATVLEVRAADRPGLLHALGSALAGGGRPALGARGHPRRPGGRRALRRRARAARPLSPPRVAQAVAALVDAGALPDSA